jgi:exosortase
MAMEDDPKTNRDFLSDRRPSLVTILGMGAVGASLLWAYWPTLAGMSDRWARDPVYSHGYLVPAFALVLLWFRRGNLAAVSYRSQWGWGLSLLLGGALLRMVGAYFYFSWFDEVSLLPLLAGLCLLLAGWETLKWCWPAIAFLSFMMPLPYQVETAMRQPLRNLATMASTYTLQTLGCPAVSEGNIITLNRKKLEVEEACSGLSMLLIFFALSTAVALVIRQPFWEKGLIVLSAVPIAIMANVARVTTTGLLYQMDNGQLAEMVLHDLAGWLMMPLALALLWIELQVLGRLLVVPERSRPIPAPVIATSLVARPRANNKSRKRRRRRIA